MHQSRSHILLMLLFLATLPEFHFALYRSLYKRELWHRTLHMSNCTSHQGSTWHAWQQRPMWLQLFHSGDSELTGTARPPWYLLLYCLPCNLKKHRRRAGMLVVPSHLDGLESTLPNEFNGWVGICGLPCPSLKLSTTPHWLPIAAGNMGFFKVSFSMLCFLVYFTT